MLKLEIEVKSIFDKASDKINLVMIIKLIGLRIL